MPSDRLAKVLAAPALDSRMRTHLRLVEASRGDAEYISELRGNPELNRYLNVTPPGVDAQLAWLERYKAREAEGEEFYFVIVCDGRAAGVVRLYDFRMIDGRNSFCWGSFIIPPPRPPGLVTYSAVLSYELGFDVLGFEQAHFDVRLGNVRMLAFHDRAGARRVATTERDAYFTLSCGAYRDLVAASSRQIRDHGTRL